MSSGGVHYFFEGFSLIKTKGLKRFVFVPLTINLVLFSVAFYFLFGQIEMGIAYVIDLVPEWLGWIKTAISFFLWPLAVISVLLIFALIFGTLANWIAAPFNGVLSEKVERHLTGQDLGDEGVMSLVKDIPRTVGRELTKEPAPLIRKSEDESEVRPDEWPGACRCCCRADRPSDRC